MNQKEVDFSLERAAALYARLDTMLFLEKKDFLVECRRYGDDPVPYEKRLALPAETKQIGDRWGEKGENAWFRLTGEIPAAWQDKEVVFQINLGGELLLFHADGTPWMGMTNTCIVEKNFNKDLCHWQKHAPAGPVELWIDAIAAGLFINGDGRFLNPGVVKSASYGLFDHEIWALKLDLGIVLAMLNAPCMVDAACPTHAVFAPGSCRYRQCAAILNEAVSVFQYNAQNAPKARQVLQKILGVKAAASAMKATAVGHGHLDVGWLWRVKESRRKAARTFSSQIDLLTRYPTYRFGASQPQVYEFVRQDYPALFARIQKAVAAGRWELQGGMWVESDCNCASGEALVRQFLHGKNFYRDHFNVDVKTVWLPDVFGYPASLPQIGKLAGCPYFVTQKLSWNRCNRFPYSVFHWVGIDNSSLLAAFPPGNSYNGTLLPGELTFGADNFFESPVQDEFLVLFGVGDGGGGPKDEHVERGFRIGDLEGVPKTAFGRAEDFFARLEKVSDSLPQYHGELYLEAHRGTYTSQARIKNGNRRCEQTLQSVENLYSRKAPDAAVRETLDWCWKKLLLNQFHDILPGSAIRDVVAVTESDHAEILHRCEALIRQLDDPKQTVEKVTFYNTLDVPYVRPVRLPDGWPGAQGLPVQKDADGDLYALCPIPALGQVTVTRNDAAAPEPMAEDAVPVLENELIRCEFDADGKLLKLIDKVNGTDLGVTGNELTVYSDFPTQCDAWEVDEMFRFDRMGEFVSDGKAVVRRTGALWQELCWTLHFGQSTVTQHCKLYSGSRELCFETFVNWQEDHRMLRAAFHTPDTVGAKSLFEIPYGHCSRPLHRETLESWVYCEEAFQRWCAREDATGGVALLNDCKYGGAVTGNALEINLLRAPSYPDPRCDRGEHRFTYTLLPYAGSVAEAGIADAAATLNRAPVLIHGTPAGIADAPVRRCSPENGVRIEVVKLAEKSDDLIVRLVETWGKPETVTLQVAPGLALYACDLLEWEQGKKISPDGKRMATLPFRPFEIRTFRLSKKS